MAACRVSLSPESCAGKETDVWFPKHQKWGDWLLPGDPLRLFLKSFLFSPSLWPVSLQRALKQRKIRRVRKRASSEAVIRPSVLNSALDLFCVVVKYPCQAELLKPTPVTLLSRALAHTIHPAVALPSPRNNPDLLHSGVSRGSKEPPYSMKALPASYLHTACSPWHVSRSWTSGLIKLRLC